MLTPLYMLVFLEPIQEDMTPDPEIMKESGFLMEDSAELSDLLNSLPREFIL